MPSIFQNLVVKKGDKNKPPTLTVTSHREIVDRFFLSPDGISFQLKQAALQAQNTAAETRLYNPLAIPLALREGVYINRHLPNPLVGFKDRYSQLVNTSSELNSRVRNQGRTVITPFIKSAGMRYAALGVADLSLKFPLTDPNKYLFLGPSLPLNLLRLPLIYSQIASGTKYSQPYMMAKTSLRDMGFGVINNLNSRSFLTDPIGNIQAITRGVTSIVNGIRNIRSPEDLVNANFYFNKYNQSYTYRDFVTEMNDEYIATGTIVSGRFANTILGSRSAALLRQIQLLDVEDRAAAYGKFFSDADTSAAAAVAAQAQALFNNISPVGNLNLLNVIPSREDVIESSSPRKRSMVVDYGLAGRSYENSAPSPDKINMLGVIDASELGENYPYVYSAEDGDVQDLLPFRFYDIVNKKLLVFRSTFDGFTDSVSAEWNSFKYVGRPDKLATYTGAASSVSFSFVVYASSRREVVPMWEKINYLKGLAWPASYTTGTLNYMKPPLIKFTVGDYYINVPGYMNSVTITIDGDYPWDLDGIETPGGNNHRLPMMVKLDVGIDILEKTVPVTGATLIGR